MTNHHDSPAPEQSSGKKKKRFGRKLAALLLIACAVLAVAALTTMEEDGVHFASLRRWLMYGETSGSADVYAYAADPNNRYGKLGTSLLVVNPNSAQLISENGAVLFDQPLRMSHPQLSVGKNLAAVCGVGEDTIYILDQNGLVRTLRTERDMQYYSARLNSRDELAVTGQKTGYKTAVSVYSAEGTLLFDFGSHDNYLSDAIVTEDGLYAVIVSMESQGGIYASRLLVYDVKSAGQVSGASIRDGLVQDFFCNQDRVVSLCDKRFAITDLEGNTLLDRSYGNLYLHDYALTGEDFAALLLGRYQAGNICTLVTYGLDGQQIASMEVREEVLDMEARGGYLAVLYGDRLVVYQKDLTEYASLEETGYAGQIKMEDGGSVLLVSGTFAWRFLP